LKKVATVFLILMLIMLYGCRRINSIETDTSRNEIDTYLNITTTNKLLYHMVKDIIKDKHHVDYMFDDEEDQWNFQYTEEWTVNISKKDIFIYTGGGYEPWIQDFIGELRKGRMRIVNASRGIKVLSLNTPIVYRDIEIKENPYFWLNPDDYKIALLNIKNSIQEHDPRNREFYETNFNQCINDLDEYIKELKRLSSYLEKYNFILSGDRMDYFIKACNLKTIKIYEETIKDIDEVEIIEKALGEGENIIFLYDDELLLKENRNIIDKYEMSPVKLYVNKFDVGYLELLEYNLNSLRLYLKE
jgi:zinc/manganese transport system substrate-binding protein